MPVINLPKLAVFHPKNTQVIDLQGLQDVITGNYLNAAVVTATLYDDRGRVDPIINELVLVYVPGSNGNYQGTVPFQFDARDGDGYKLNIMAVQAGVQSLYTLPAKVTPRSNQ